jgi:hypothetical protein
LVSADNLGSGIGLFSLELTLGKSSHASMGVGSKVVS